jgi:hypothetical protein
MLLVYARGNITTNRMWGRIMSWYPDLATRLSEHPHLRFGTGIHHPIVLPSPGSLADAISTCGFTHLEPDQQIPILWTASTALSQKIMGAAWSRLNARLGNTIPPHELPSIGIASLLIYDVRLHLHVADKYITDHTCSS